MTQTSNPAPPLKQIGHVYRTFARLADGELRDLGFAMSQLPVLMALKKGEALTQAELAASPRSSNQAWPNCSTGWNATALCNVHPTPTTSASA